MAGMVTSTHPLPKIISLHSEAYHARKHWGRLKIAKISPEISIFSWSQNGRPPDEKIVNNLRPDLRPTSVALMRSNSYVRRALMFCDRNGSKCTKS